MLYKLLKQSSYYGLEDEERKELKKCLGDRCLIKPTKQGDDYITYVNINSIDDLMELQKICGICSAINFERKYIILLDDIDDQRLECEDELDDLADDCFDDDDDDSSLLS